MRTSKILVLAAIVSLGACKQSEYKTLPNGLKYKIISAHAGQKPKIGDYMVLQVFTTVGDTILKNTYAEKSPEFVPLQPGRGRFDMMDGLVLLSAGDSAVFLIPADSVMKGPSRPIFVKNGDTLIIYIKMVAIETPAQRIQQAKAQYDAQMATDDSSIQQYLVANNLNFVKTKLGEYIVTQKEGEGDTAKVGQLVSINYTGKIMNGEVFDSNTDSAFHHSGSPLSFPVGLGEMIKGMDDGLLHLKKGAKATLYIPSVLAYGSHGASPKIAPNSILEFDVEVLDIKDQKRPPTSAMSKGLKLLPGKGVRPPAAKTPAAK